MKEEAKEKYILFSAVSQFDPLSWKDSTDGPMLHICREYKPEKIILYLTEDMHEIHEDDHRYEKAIEWLYENADFKPEVIPIKGEVKEVHKFAPFFKEFEDLLTKFHKAYPEFKMLVNVSSGTPQMEANLYALSSFLPFPIKMVQTKTPENGQNTEQKHEYNLKKHWENNEENNNPNYERRCIDVTNRTLNVEIQKKNIGILLDSYDYDAALKLAQDDEFKELFDVNAIELLKAAKKRSELYSSNIPKKIKLLFKIDMDAANKYLDLEEYLLWLEMKLKRRDLGDYLRCITPALFELMKLAVEDKYSFKIQEEYCKKDKKNLNNYSAYFSDECKTIYNSRGNGEYKKYEFLKILIDHKNEDGNSARIGLGDFLSSKHYTAVVEDKYSNKKWKDPLCLLRAVETTVRNDLAHTITPITEEKIETTLNAKEKLRKGKKVDKAASEKNGYPTKTTGIKTVEDIQSLIEEAVKFLNEDNKNIENTRLNVNWGAYDEMNKEIKKAFNIPINESQNS